MEQGLELLPCLLNRYYFRKSNVPILHTISLDWKKTANDCKQKAAITVISRLQHE